MDNYNLEFIRKFWVGLMDGDGSIQVNHWRKSSLQFRLVIKLAPLALNKLMLDIICQYLGGKVRYNMKHTKYDSVVWVVNDKNKVIHICTIFDYYPPLTSRLICQLRFLKACLLLSKQNIDWYFENINLKYRFQFTIIDDFNLKYHIPNYFDVWVLGFIEAEGCFCVRQSGNNSFSIGQLNDMYLLRAIRDYFGGTNTIRKLNNQNFYIWEVYKREVLNNIINHCSNPPLLGAKFTNLQIFINSL